jgi:hypothetical protein
MIEVEGRSAGDGLRKGGLGPVQVTLLVVEQAQVGVVGGPVGVERQRTLEGGDGAVEIIQAAVDQPELAVNDGHLGVAAGGFFEQEGGGGVVAVIGSLDAGVVGQDAVEVEPGEGNEENWKEL